MVKLPRLHRHAATSWRPGDRVASWPLLVVASTQRPHVCASRPRRRAQVRDLSAAPFVKRELALIKVRCDAGQRRELTDLAAIFHGSICDVSLGTVTLEMQGKETKMAALQGLLAPYGARAAPPLLPCACMSDEGPMCANISMTGCWRKGLACICASCPSKAI